MHFSLKQYQTYSRFNTFFSILLHFCFSLCIPFWEAFWMSTKTHTFIERKCAEMVGRGCILANAINICTIFESISMMHRNWFIVSLRLYPLWIPQNKIIHKTWNTYNAQIISKWPLQRKHSHTHTSMSERSIQVKLPFIYEIFLFIFSLY